MFAKTYSAQLRGLSPELVCVETDISKGLHSFNMIGLPDKATEEARGRINAAIKNSGFKPPIRGNRKVTIALAPANLQKSGSHFDVALTLSYLKANKDLTFDEKNKLFLGELSLDGSVKKITGTLLLTKMAKELGFEEIYVPEENTREAGLIKNIKIFGLKNLKSLINHLDTRPKKDTTSDQRIFLTPARATKINTANQNFEVDFSDVKGQEEVKRALIIAASGGHNIAMTGTPGVGKSMLAKAFNSILPPLSFDEIIETSGIHSAAGIIERNLVTHRPFRSPHHTSSYVSLIGGGNDPKPGEVSLAHKGVLFLDEFPEFDRRVIESLRQPLEEKSIIIARSKGVYKFPANFILVAAMNPCPCGYKNSKHKNCTCSPVEQNRYHKKISGPIIDRIDIWIEVPEIKHEILLVKNKTQETSSMVKEKVVLARNIQSERFKNYPIKTNAEMSPKELLQFANLTKDLQDILNQAAKRLGLSARAYHRVIKLARTIADLDNKQNIEAGHILEALQYRAKNKA